MPLPLVVPGGVELVIIFLVMVLLFGVPLALVAGYVVLTRMRRGDAITEEDLAELKAEMAEMRAALEDVREEKDEE